MKLLGLIDELSIVSFLQMEAVGDLCDCLIRTWEAASLIERCYVVDKLCGCAGACCEACILCCCDRPYVRKTRLDEDEPVSQVMEYPRQPAPAKL